MKREIQKIANKNIVLIKDLMELTYAHSRRLTIMSETVSVKQIMTTYPTLQMVSEASLEIPLHLILISL